MSEHRRKLPQSQEGGRAAARRGQSGSTSGRRAAPRSATGSPSDAYGSGVKRSARTVVVPRPAVRRREAVAAAGAEEPTAPETAAQEAEADVAAPGARTGPGVAAAVHLGP